MRTREIPSDEWTAFFDEFSRRHRGWLAKVTVLDPRLGAQVEAAGLPLQGIVADARGHGIAIGLGSGPDDFARGVRRPTRVWVELAGERDEAVAAIEIESADGTKTILEFRVAALPETVDGAAASSAFLQ